MNDLTIGVLQHYQASSEAPPWQHLAPLLPIGIGLVLALLVFLSRPGKSWAILLAIFKRPLHESTIVTHTGGHVYSVGADMTVSSAGVGGGDGPDSPESKAGRP
jgi:hypothetical protein